jgi:coatomer subunit beta
MPSKSKPLKKLLYAYWEICPKLNPDGKLKQEMILVWYLSLKTSILILSNAIRNDLQHPNEYVCGMTLRFLCKLQEAELLEPLLPSCRACLVIDSCPLSDIRHTGTHMFVKMPFSPSIPSIIILNT